MTIHTNIDALSPIVARPYQSADDFWQVRNLLIDTYPLTPPDFNWELRRWDGWHFHRREEDQAPWDKIQLWENEKGQVVTAVHPEDGGGDAFLQIHPDYRHLEEEMIIWAEVNLAGPTEDGQATQLEFFVFEYDSPRRSLLIKRGYEKMTYGGVTRRLRFGKRPLPPPNIAQGYQLRTTTPGEDYKRVADILNAAFNRNFHTTAEVKRFMRQSPSFRHDLDLVAEAANGLFASYVGVTYDEINRRGIFEPVCTHPKHQRKGLARSLMFEGLSRLKALGATDVYVGTGDMVAANRLYEAVGFTEAYKGYIWRKLF